VADSAKALPTFTSVINQPNRLKSTLNFQEL